MADISSMGSTSAVIFLSSPAGSMRSRNSRRSEGPIPWNCCVSILVTAVSAPIAGTDISPSFIRLQRLVHVESHSNRKV